MRLGPEPGVQPGAFKPAVQPRGNVATLFLLTVFVAILIGMLIVACWAAGILGHVFWDVLVAGWRWNR